MDGRLNPIQLAHRPRTDLDGGWSFELSLVQSRLNMGLTSEEVSAVHHIAFIDCEGIFLERRFSTRTINEESARLQWEG
jgi:hypothetical protein